MILANLFNQNGHEKLKLCVSESLAHIKPYPDNVTTAANHIGVQLGKIEHGYAGYQQLKDMAKSDDAKLLLKTMTEEYKASPVYVVQRGPGVKKE